MSENPPLGWPAEASGQQVVGSVGSLLAPLIGPFQVHRVAALLLLPLRRQPVGRPEMRSSWAWPACDYDNIYRGRHIARRPEDWQQAATSGGLRDGLFCMAPSGSSRPLWPPVADPAHTGRPLFSRAATPTTCYLLPAGRPAVGRFPEPLALWETETRTIRPRASSRRLGVNGAVLHSGATWPVV